MPDALGLDLEHILAHTAGVWKELAGARIFITGGTGFFGYWLLESFAYAVDRLELDASAMVLTRSPERFAAKAPHLARHRAIHLLPGDVRRFDFPAGRFTHVIHGAAEASAKLNREQPGTMLETIVDGTRRTLEFAAAAGAERFLLIGSGAVYGPQPPDMQRIPETWLGGPDSTDPAAAYAEGKRTAELLCAISGLDCSLARCFAFTGPHLPLDAHFAIGNFIRDCLCSRAIQVRGDGSAYRSYLYAADLAIWLWTLLARGARGRAYNVGSENAIGMAELASQVRETLASPYEVHIAQPRHEGPAERYVPDTTRAREELGLAEWISLAESIRRTALYAAPAFSQGVGA